MRPPNRFWTTIIVILIFVLIYIRLKNAETKITISILGQDDGSRRSMAVQKKSNNSMTCNIPKLEQNGSDVINFFHAPKKINCGKGPNWVYIDAEKKVQLIPERKGAVCQAQTMSFGTDSENKYGNWENLQFGKLLPSEMANVKCTLGRAKWDAPLMTVRKIEKSENKSKRKQWSVLMMSFDSVSQMTFRRKLPKTVKFLEDQLGTVVLNGYNIVGDGTPQAFIPILTGATEEELPLTRKRFKEASFVDDVYPFIWKNYSHAGMMNHRLKGFRKPPSDHYTRPYFNYLEEQLWSHNVQCIGADVQHKHWLRYAREFAEAYHPSTPRFGLLHHCAYSHDDINLIGSMDDDFAAWLRSMNEDGLLDDTILIVMADHGHRFAQLRATHQGQLEERLPFYSFTLPKTLRETEEGAKARNTLGNPAGIEQNAFFQMHKNLLMNKDRLSTPFDIHQTLHDIIQLPEDLDSEQAIAVNSRSLSLLRPIPASRNCDQAGIAPHWCTCLDWKDAMTTDYDRKVSNQIAEAIVQSFNEQLKDELKICSPLKLKGIEYAKKLIPKDDLLKYASVKDNDGFVPDLSGSTKATHAHYQIKLATTPGRGVYEVTVLFDFLARHLTLDLASVSHVSRYGDDPHCIIDRNYFLATYCVCYDRI